MLIISTTGFSQKIAVACNWFRQICQNTSIGFIYPKPTWQVKKTKPMWLCIFRALVKQIPIKIINKIEIYSISLKSGSLFARLFSPRTKA